MLYSYYNSKLISDIVLAVNFRQLLCSKYKVTVFAAQHVVLSVNADTCINDCAWTFSLHCLHKCDAVRKEINMKKFLYS